MCKRQRFHHAKQWASTITQDNRNYIGLEIQTFHLISSKRTYLIIIYNSKNIRFFNRACDKTERNKKSEELSKIKELKKMKINIVRDKK